MYENATSLQSCHLARLEERTPRESAVRSPPQGTQLCSRTTSALQVGSRVRLEQVSAAAMWACAAPKTERLRPREGAFVPTLMQLQGARPHFCASTDPEQAAARIHKGKTSGPSHLSKFEPRQRSRDASSKTDVSLCVSEIAQTMRTANNGSMKKPQHEGSSHSTARQWWPPARCRLNPRDTRAKSGCAHN